MGAIELKMGSSRRAMLIVAAYLAIAMTFIAEGAYNAMALPIQVDFGITVESANLLRAIPETAGLAIVFVAGALSVRFGRRAMMVVASGAFAGGSALMALAPSPEVLIVARSIGGLGSVALTVVGLSLINVTFTDSGERGRAFGVVAALTPAVFLVVPTLSGLVCDTVGWRVVPALLAVVAVVLLVLARLSIPADESRPAAREMVTPALAGIVLSAFCVAVSSIVERGPLTLGAVAVVVAGTALLVGLMRRLPSPGLDLRILRAPGGLAATAAVFLVFCVTLSFYISVFLQARYAYGVTHTSLLISLCEVAGIGGALAIGRLASRVGSRRAAVLSLSMTAGLSLLFLVLPATSSVWPYIAVAVLVSIFNLGSFGPVTEHMLDLAKDDGSDAASALQEAAASLGYVVGALLIVSVAFSGFEASLSHRLQAGGVSANEAQAIASDIRSGTLTGDLVVREEAKYEALRSVMDQHPHTVERAQADGLRIVALGLSATSGAAALLLLRRRRRTPVPH